MHNKILASLTLEDNTPIERLYPGWEIITRQAAPGGMDIVHLHKCYDEQEAFWWVTPEGRHIASHTLALKSPYSDALLQHLKPFFTPLMEGSLGGIPPENIPTHDPNFIIIVSLPQYALLQVIDFWLHHTAVNTLILSPKAILNQEDDENSSITITEAQSPFSPTRLKSLFNAQYNGKETFIISPFSEEPLRTQLTLSLPKGMACRFRDPYDNLTFYLFWPHIPTEKPILYFQEGALLLGDHPLTPTVPAQLLAWFLMHPKHPQEIQRAVPFRIEDYGVGNTSSFW